MDQEDLARLGKILEGAQEVTPKSGVTPGEYTHSYSVTGQLTGIDLPPHEGAYEMDLGDEKAEFESAGKNRNVLRTTLPLDELLQGARNHELY